MKRKTQLCFGIKYSTEDGGISGPTIFANSHLSENVSIRPGIFATNLGTNLFCSLRLWSPRIVSKKEQLTTSFFGEVSGVAPIYNRSYNRPYGEISGGIHGLSGRHLFTESFVKINSDGFASIGVMFGENI